MQKEKYKQKLRAEPATKEQMEKVCSKKKKALGRRYERKGSTKPVREELYERRAVSKKETAGEVKKRDGPKMPEEAPFLKGKPEKQEEKVSNARYEVRQEEAFLRGELPKTVAGEHQQARRYQNKKAVFFQKKEDSSGKLAASLKGIKPMVRPVREAAKYHVNSSRKAADTSEHEEGAAEKTGQMQGAFAIYGMEKTGQSAQKIRDKMHRRYRTAGEKKLTEPDRENNGIVTKMDMVWQEKKNREKRFKARIEAVFQNESASDLIVKAVRKIEEAVMKNRLILIAAMLIICLFISAISAAGIFLEAVTKSAGSLLEGYSMATDQSLTEADNYFSQLEAALRERIDNMETERPGYDEYIFDLAEIGHDETLLMAYLSAVYGEYDLAMVKGNLDALFTDMYRLEFEETSEERTDSDGNSQTYRTLKITLLKKSWDELMASRIDDKRRRDYETYADTGGMHQAFANPFSENWAGKISSRFGWRIHPISGEEKFHQGVDIAMPAGTQVNSCSVGTVVRSYYSDSAGNYVVVRDASGYECHYMHLSERSVREGDQVTNLSKIGTVGSTGRSTGAHLHLGIKDADGQWLNPLFMVQGGV